MSIFNICKRYGFHQQSLWSTPMCFISQSKTYHFRHREMSTFYSYSYLLLCVVMLTRSYWSRCNWKTISIIHNRRGASLGDLGPTLKMVTTLKNRKCGVVCGERAENGVVKFFRKPLKISNVLKTSVDSNARRDVELNPICSVMA